MIVGAEETLLIDTQTYEESYQQMNLELIGSNIQVSYLYDLEL
jgi:hypothetical protein